MKSQLVGGKLVPPTTDYSGQIRHQQLVHEIESLEKVIKSLRPKEGADLDRDARHRAQGNLGWLKAEEIQLRRWLKARGAEILPAKERVA